MSGRRTALVALVAATLGTAVGWLAPGASSRPDAGEAPAAASPAPAAKPVAVPAVPSRVVQAPKRALDEMAPTADEEAWLKAALERERDRRGKSVIREDDGGLEVLDRWATADADVAPLVSDFASMRRHVRVPDGPAARVDSTGDVTNVDLSAIDPKAVVIEFGPGRFLLTRGNTQWNVRRADVEALEIRGAGIDRTTLVGPGWAFLCIDEKASARNVVLRDFTIDSTDPGQIVLDARGSMSVAVERVRFLGWEVAGHASVVGVTGRAFLACRDCEFVGPGDGYAVSLRGGALAVLEKCRFSDLGSTLIGGGADSLGRPSVVTLRDCTFENAALADSRINGKSGPAMEISVHGGSVAVGGKTWTEDARRKKWGAEHAVVVDGVTFGPGVPSFAVADLLRVLEAAPGQGIDAVVRVDVEPGGRARPTVVDLYAWDRAAEKATRRSFRWVDATLVPLVEKDRRRGVSSVDLTGDDLAACLPMLELVRRSLVAADESVRSVEFRCMTQQTSAGVEERRRWLMIQSASQGWMVDAVTGVPLGNR